MATRGDHQGKVTFRCRRGKALKRVIENLVKRLLMPKGDLERPKALYRRMSLELRGPNTIKGACHRIKNYVGFAQLRGGKECPSHHLGDHHRPESILPGRAGFKKG